MRKSAFTSSSWSFPPLREEREDLPHGRFPREVSRRFRSLSPIGRHAFPQGASRGKRVSRYADRQELFIEAVYGGERGSQRRQAVRFSEDPYIDSPETYTIDPIADVWGRMSDEYMKSIRGGGPPYGAGFRSEGYPYWSQNVALSPTRPRVCKSCTFWENPRNRRIIPARGYWRGVSCRGSNI